MKFTRLTENRCRALLSLARFNYLTKRQFLEIGITSDLSNLTKRVLSPLMEGKDPLIQLANVGSTHVFALTSKGAEWAASDLLVSSVFHPPNGIQYIRDLKHRSGTIDFLIKVWTYARDHSLQIERCSTYFHNSSKKPSTFVSATRREISHGLFTEADLEFRLLLPENKEAFHYLFEFHRSHRAKRIHEQLEHHRLALERGLISAPHVKVLVLSVYEELTTRDTVMARIRADTPFDSFRQQFVFATLNEVLPDLNVGWKKLISCDAPVFPKDC